MSIGWQIHDDGTFDATTGALALQRAWPHLDTRPVAPIQVEVKRHGDGGEITYRLADGTLRLTLDQDDDHTLSLTARLEGVARSPFSVEPFVVRLDGATQLFRQGLGFSGPSGVEPVQRRDAWTLDSYLMSAIVERPGGLAVTLAADDHRDYLQKTTLYNRIETRGLVNRHPVSNEVYASVGFRTERTPARDGVVALPTLRLTAGPDLSTTLRRTAKRIAAAMSCRTHHPPRYHWCSWYDGGPFYTRQRLDAHLAALKQLDPPVPLQALQIDDGYHPHLGDWIEHNDRWPGGMASAFETIRAAGYTPGIWVGPFMVGCRSRVYREHPDWVIHDHDGRPIPEWRRYNGTLADPEVYALDASHPAVREHLGHVFRTLRSWGAGFFKTDFMDWGLKDSPHVRRHNPDETSVQSFRKTLAVIRDAIGDESYWLACISPYGPFLGFADGMRIANDVGARWNEGGTGNMFHESQAVQYFNNVFWQNDNDVLYLREQRSELTAEEMRTIALWDGIGGGSINTSDDFGELTPERLALWRFLQPQAERWTARMPGWDVPGRATRIAVRRYASPGAWAVLVINPSNALVTEALPLHEAVGLDVARVWRWSERGAEPLGRQDLLLARLAPHGSALFYVAVDDAPPPAGLTLGGATA